MAPVDRSSQNDVNLVRGPVAGKWNAQRARQQFAIQLHSSDSKGNARRIINLNLIGRRMVSKTNGVSRPVFGDTRVDKKHRAPDTKTQDPLYPGAVEPAGGACVPCPSTTSHMGRLGVNIASDNVRLHFVALHARAR